MRKIIYMAGATASCVALEIIRELHTFRRVRYTVASPKLNGMDGKRKIIFLSDLHNVSYGEKNHRLYGAIRKEKPDCILVGGDMLVGKRSCSYEDVLSFLARLRKLCPVYCANGNHEQKMKTYPEFYRGKYEKYKSALQKRGIPILENRRETFSWEDARIGVTGLEIPLWGYQKHKGKPVQKRDLDRILAPKPEGFEIVLAHNPKYMDAYKMWGGDLFLSGHYHGGIVGLPRGRGVISPDFRLFPPYVAGKHRLSKNSTAIISRGLGVHTIPLRLWNPAEIVVITLQGEKEYGNTGEASGI